MDPNSICNTMQPDPGVVGGWHGRNPDKGVDRTLSSDMDNCRLIFHKQQSAYARIHAGILRLLLFSAKL